MDYSISLKALAEPPLASVRAGDLDGEQIALPLVDAGVAQRGRREAAMEPAQALGLGVERRGSTSR
jgi:hypothetical protein